MIPNPDVSVFDQGPNTEERCGLILKRTDNSFYIMELPNRAVDSKRYYAIVKSDMDSADIPDSDSVVGFIHTHPFRFPRRPSGHDIDAIPDGMIGMVYHPSSGSTVWYDRNGIVQEQLKRRR